MCTHLVDPNRHLHHPVLPPAELLWVYQPPDMSGNATYAPSKLPLHVLGSGPHLIRFLGPTLYPKRHLDWFSRFCTEYFTMGCPVLPSKLCFCTGDLNRHLIHSSLGSPKWHLDQFSRFSGLTIVTDRQLYSICNNRLHLHSTAMWPLSHYKVTTSKVVNPTERLMHYQLPSSATWSPQRERPWHSSRSSRCTWQPHRTSSSYVVELCRSGKRSDLTWSLPLYTHTHTHRQQSITIKINSSVYTVIPVTPG